MKRMTPIGVIFLGSGLAWLILNNRRVIVPVPPKPRPIPKPNAPKAAPVALSQADKEAARVAMLRPEVAQAWRKLAGWALAKFGVTLHPTTTVRSVAEQAKQKAEGRTDVSLSFHDPDVRAAIDFYLFDADKVVSWDTQLPMLKAIVKEAEILGFRSLAFNVDGSKKWIQTSKGKVWDAGHIEYPSKEIVAIRNKLKADRGVA